MAVDGRLVQAVRAALAQVVGVRLAYLFGSQVRGGARPNSDLDVAVLYEESLPPAERERARRQLVAALSDALGRLGEAVDVVDLEHAGSALGFRVIREGVLLAAVDAATRVRFEARTARRYDDDAFRRRLMRRAARRVGQSMGADQHGRQ